MAEKEKGVERVKNTQVKHVPKDAQVIMSMLKEVGIQDYEPRVINQLLEFTYRYVTCILDDAKAFANHARKKTIDLDDVNLAVEMVNDKSFTSPPPRHILAKLAEARNSMPLPPVKPHCGLRLPPDRYCLSGCNYKVRAACVPKKMTKSALEGRSTIKTQIKASGSGAGGGLKRQPMAPPKTQVVTIPKPVIKFTTTSKTGVPIEKKEELKVEPEVKMEIDDAATSASAVVTIGGLASGGPLKREREEDEFEMVP
ncbi:transcription initiation factor TFIID subunit 9 [Teleopsis dalmanni]|uniref:transcription initiation factor TFIID subunit 9 n=1 Tax=Teleopsis dalmanni TaxID=139649 RepID=UPI0018CFC114|nr:transcription initiation factor TFIID subunit 9 [Teleopsis dalmanni]